MSKMDRMNALLKKMTSKFTNDYHHQFEHSLLSAKGGLIIMFLSTKII